MAPAYVFRMFRTTKVLLLELVSTTRRHGAPPKTPGAWSRWWVRGTTGRRPTAPPPSGAAAGLRRLRGAGKPLLAFGVLLNNTAALDLDEPDESWGEGHAHSRPPWTVRAHHRHRAGVTSVRWPVRPRSSYCGWHGSAAWIPPMGTAGRSPARRGAHAPHPVPARPAARGAAVRGDRGIAPAERHIR